VKEALVGVVRLRKSTLRKRSSMQRDQRINSSVHLE
jgi:hypothetical protein